MIKNDSYYMNLALKEAKKAYQKGEVPIGAIVVDNKNHKILARTHNLKETKNDVTNHAEILAIKKASKKINNWRLENCTIYVTLEPCMMCASAIIQSRIDRVVYALHEPNTGGFGGKIDLTRFEKTNLTIKNRVLEEEAKSLLQDFFESRRK